MTLHELARVARIRANGRCQYCLMHESLRGATFHIEHVFPKSKGGQTDLNNVVLACPGCNLHKGSKIKAIDPVSGSDTPLFHPIQQSWSDHFCIVERRIEGLTAAGRATVRVLDLNQIRRQRIREVEEAFGLFPPAIS